VVEIGSRQVDQAGRLLLNRGDDFWMAVPGCDNSDSGRKIKKTVPVRIFYYGGLGSLRHQRVGAGVSRRHNSLITLDNRCSFGPWKGGDDPGHVLKGSVFLHLKPSGAHL